VQANGGSAGVLLASEGTLGLAHLKLAPALAAAASSSGAPAAGGVLQVVGEDGAWVVPVRPAWWPPEWGHEEGGGGGAR